MFRWWYRFLGFEHRTGCWSCQSSRTSSPPAAAPPCLLYDNGVSLAKSFSSQLSVVSDYFFPPRRGGSATEKGIKWGSSVSAPICGKVFQSRDLTWIKLTTVKMIASPSRDGRHKQQLTPRVPLGLVFFFFSPNKAGDVWKQLVVAFPHWVSQKKLHHQSEVDSWFYEPFPECKKLKRNFNTCLSLLKHLANTTDSLYLHDNNDQKDEEGDTRALVKPPYSKSVVCSRQTPTLSQREKK